MLPRSFQSQPKATAAQSVTPKPERSVACLGKGLHPVNQPLQRPNPHQRNLQRANRSSRSKRPLLRRRNSSCCCCETASSGSTGRQQTHATVGEGCRPTRSACTCWKHVGWINAEKTCNGASAPNGGDDNLHTSTGCCPCPKSPCPLEAPGSPEASGRRQTVSARTR